MPASYDFHKVPTNKITVDRDLRQRSEASIGISELIRSIDKIGLLHPIIITRDNRLIAGERRLLAWKEITKEPIPVHYIDQLDDAELKLIEFEENIKRKSLPWKDTVNAVSSYHQLRLEQDPSWTGDATADELGFDRSHVFNIINIARELKKGNEKIVNAEGMKAAINILSRQENRELQTELSIIEDVVDRTLASPTVKDVKEVDDLSHSEVLSPIHIKTPEFLCQDVVSWLESYSGPKFNFLHCDLPYGIGINKSAKSKTKRWEEYDDSEENYWKLCAALVTNKDKILYSSSHVMFWFSMVYYEKTRLFFETAGFTVNPFPLIWHKSDNKGITPDYKRGPRRSYETAFLMTLGERYIITPIQNVFSAATTKEGHPSEKPEAVLEHFFRMLVDEHTEMLDPTCGAGSALRVAERLDVKRMLGIDVSEEYIDTAKTLLHAQRSLRDD